MAQNNAFTFAVSCGVLQGIMLLLYIVRIYSRLYPNRNLWWDDYTISLAVALAVVGYALRLVAVHYGMGSHNWVIAPEDGIQAMKYSFIASCLWYFSVALMRVSVACLLLRFRQSQGPSWVLMLRIIIATQLILAFTALVVQVNICHPLRACWEPVEDFTCLPGRFLIIWGYCHTVMGILTDLVLSAMPISFIVKINTTPARRILISLLMATGLLTTTSAIIKTVYISQYITGDDPLWDTYYLSFWSHLEEVIGIIAACMPCIRARVEALLRRFDISWITSSVMLTLHTYKTKFTHQEADILVSGGMDGRDGFRNQDTIRMEDRADRTGHSRAGERSLTEQRSFSESGTAPCEGWTTV